MTAYYNEIDPYAAQWLRNLTAAGHIAPGIVDERSIEDVQPDEIREFTQCHFFAGVGVWSHALRHAGWPDERPVWTGSCPCQPFSAAGKGVGFDDERHLWPAFHWLIKECRPAIVFGEQVASKAVDAWVDLVHTDLETLDYAFGAVAFPSAGVGAPHIRDRTYWVADSSYERRDTIDALLRQETRGWDARDILETAGRGEVGGLGNSSSTGSGRNAGTVSRAERKSTAERRDSGYLADESVAASAISGMADAVIDGPQRSAEQALQGAREWEEGGAPGRRGSRLAGDEPTTGPTNGFWRDADWLLCRDGKWRPVEPSTFPLAHGASARVGRLRAYGNAINAEAARAFIETAMDCLP